MNKATLENMLRNDILKSISDFLSQKYETDILPISAGGITLPLLDAEGNEKYAKITVQIPRGTRNGEGGYTEYNGYSEAEAYKEACETRAAKKAASAAKKEAAEKLREHKRALRAKKTPAVNTNDEITV